MVVRQAVATLIMDLLGTTAFFLHVFSSKMRRKIVFPTWSQASTSIASFTCMKQAFASITTKRSAWFFQRDAITCFLRKCAAKLCFLHRHRHQLQLRPLPAWNRLLLLSPQNAALDSFREMRSRVFFENAPRAASYYGYQFRNTNRSHVSCPPSCRYLHHGFTWNHTAFFLHVFSSKTRRNFVFPTSAQASTSIASFTCMKQAFASITTKRSAWFFQRDAITCFLRKCAAGSLILRISLRTPIAVFVALCIFVWHFVSVWPRRCTFLKRVGVAPCLRCAVYLRLTFRIGLVPTLHIS